MSTNFGTMVPGADVDFSFDLAGKIPLGETLTGGTVNVRSGAAAAQITFLEIEGTKVLFNVTALAKGYVTFDILGAFSGGKDDGEQAHIVIK